MLAVFPDEAARVAAQPLLDSSADACPTDPGVVRPGSRLWVGQANVLVLVYGSDAADATRTALSTATSPTQTYRAIIGFPAANADESYRVLIDFLARRESGNLENRPIAGPAVEPPVSKGADAVATNYAAYVADAKRRYLANALSFSVGPARTPAEADVGTAVWNVLTSNAVPGTARLFEVDHPGSTVPALRHEVYVAYQYKNPSAASWTLLLVDAEPWPSES